MLSIEAPKNFVRNGGGNSHDQSDFQRGTEGFRWHGEAARKGARYLIHRHNKGIAAIVSVEDLALLEVIERRRDLKAARQALEEIEREGTIPWDQAKAELGL